MSLHDPKRTDINVAIVGVGNCASSLVQGIAHYSNGGANEQIGLSHWDLGGYRPKDLKVVARWPVVPLRALSTPVVTLNHWPDRRRTIGENCQFW